MSRMRFGRLVRSTAVAALVAVVAVGCGGADSEDDAAGGHAGADGGVSEPEAAPPAEREESGQDADSGSAAGRIDPAGRAVIHHIVLTIETEDVMAAAQQASQAVEAGGGYVESESTERTSDDGEPDFVQLVLRVPVDRRGDLATRIENLGTLLERSRSADDVTDQLVDVQSRIDSQRRSIDRLRALLDQAANLRDVISVENELARREADLDSLLRRQEELSKLSSLATITVTFVAQGTTDASKLGFLAGLRSGWRAFVQVATIAATVLGGLVPFAVAALVIAPPIWLVVRRVRRGRRGQQATVGSGPT